MFSTLAFVCQGQDRQALGLFQSSAELLTSVTVQHQSLPLAAWWSFSCQTRERANHPPTNPPQSQPNRPTSGRPTTSKHTNLLALQAHTHELECLPLPLHGTAQHSTAIHHTAMHCTTMYIHDLSPYSYYLDFSPNHRHSVTTQLLADLLLF